MSEMTLLQAIQCLQCPTRHGERDRAAAAGVLHATLRRYAAFWLRRKLIAACDADDLVQQLFERLWRILPGKHGLSTDAAIKSYLQKCLRRDALRAIKRSSRSPLVSDITRMLADDGRTDHGYERGLHQELEALIHFAAQRRSAKQRAWLTESAHEMLCYLIGEGPSRDDLSKLRKISINNLYQRHKRTRVALRDALDPFCRARDLPDEVRRLLTACLDGLTRL
jgi:DNA-directed RNA polymerase specialized sigma24 family protein